VHARDPAFHRLEAMHAAIEEAARERRADAGHQYLACGADGRIVGRVNLRNVRRGHFRSA